MNESLEVEERIYKKVDGHEMVCRIYRQRSGDRSTLQPGIMFYFGGGWTGGTMDQFKGQSTYLAGLGLTCITVDYRVKSRHGTSPFDCLDDCRDSVQWVIDNGETLGIDRSRIVLVGGSAGGHMALITALLHKDLMRDHLVGLVLFNPVTDTTETGFAHERFLGKGREASPIHNIRKDFPRTLIFHGTADTTVPYEDSLRFTMAMIRAGNPCDLIPFEGEDHGFFNDYRNMANYQKTLEQTEAFLEGLSLI